MYKVCDSLKSDCVSLIDQSCIPVNVEKHHTVVISNDVILHCVERGLKYNMSTHKQIVSFRAIF